MRALNYSSATLNPFDTSKHNVIKKATQSQNEILLPCVGLPPSAAILALHEIGGKAVAGGALKQPF